jgi:hypothetical protein
MKRIEISEYICTRSCRHLIKSSLCSTLDATLKETRRTASPYFFFGKFPAESVVVGFVAALAAGDTERDVAAEVAVEVAVEEAAAGAASVDTTVSVCCRLGLDLLKPV